MYVCYSVVLIYHFTKSDPFQYISTGFRAGQPNSQSHVQQLQGWLYTSRLPIESRHYHKYKNAEKYKEEPSESQIIHIIMYVN